MTRPLPSGEETARAINIALKDGGIIPDQVDYVNAHGTSTPICDAYETLVLKKVFGKHAYKLAINSTKSMIGHAVGAAGAGAVMAATMSIQDSFVHPTINQEFPDPECDLDYVPNTGRKKIVDIALCNSIAFGSKNSALILRKYKE
jgi:3-oxoacyl-[acyl-carrier-protein] synthase II